MPRSAQPQIKPQPCHLCGEATIEGCTACERPCCYKCECDCTDGMDLIEKYSGDEYAHM